MNYLCTERDQQVESTLYLNDRPYCVLDIGDGECIVVIVTNIPRYLEKNSLLSQKGRFIVVDVSESIKDVYPGISTTIHQLAKDLHLLLDVFWLEDVQIESEVEHVNMDPVFNMVSIRNSSKLQRPLSLC